MKTNSLKPWSVTPLEGCQSPDTPPNCDAGAGKVWKHLGWGSLKHRNLETNIYTPEDYGTRK